jgi:Secretion system C-terminal sorting domain
MRYVSFLVMTLLLAAGTTVFASIDPYSESDHSQQEPVPRASQNSGISDGIRVPTQISELDESHCCLVQDLQSFWGNSNQDILDLMPEVTYDILNSADIPDTDFSLYDFIIVEGNQDATFNANVLANMAQFEEYVSGGGWLQFHMGTNTHLPLMTLWDGTTYNEFINENFNYIGLGAEDHPIIAGIPEPFEGDWANHGILLNLPEEAQHIVVTAGGDPTLAEYTYGSGNVVVSTMTLEFLWASEEYHDTSGQILYNAIEYMATRPVYEPVQIEIFSDLDPPIIAPGGSFTFDVHVTSELPQTVMAYLWTAVETPDGQVISPLSQVRIPIYFGMDQWAFDIVQDIPVDASLGDYTYYLAAGLNPGNALLTDSFVFSVVWFENQEGGSDWTTRGFDSSFHLSNDSENTVSTTPNEFELAKVYPNPFNPTANVSVVLPGATQLTVGVYNVMGQQVAELSSGQFSAGKHSFVLDGSSLSSGVYFVRAMTSNGDAGMQKVMLMK